MPASEELLGLELIGGRNGKKWKVQKLLGVKPGDTPGAFSVGYLVADGQGDEAFLKASDLSMFIDQTTSVLEAFTRVTTAHAFERDVLEYCRGNSMDRVVTAVDFGEVEIIYHGVRDFVFFLIFELAKCDLREHVTRSNSFNLLMSTTILHNVFVATSQLHGSKIAHNDIKPSNALVIDEQIQKVADLGRATSANHPASHDSLLCAGDNRFAPPEQLYPVDLNCDHVDRNDRRRVGDLYNLGSLVFYMVSSRMLTPEIIVKLRPETRPRNMSGGSQASYQVALPFWRDALQQCVSDFTDLGEGRFGPGVRPELNRMRAMVNELCEPDPLLRGHPGNRFGKQDRFGLSRYISELDSMKSKLKVKSA